jgi:hypothetical protein
MRPATPSPWSLNKVASVPSSAGDELRVNEGRKFALLWAYFVTRGATGLGIHPPGVLTIVV